MTKKKNQSIRDGYYKTSDGIFKLAVEAMEEEDKKFQDLLTSVREALDAVHNHLEENYLWD